MGNQTGLRGIFLSAEENPLSQHRKAVHTEAGRRHPLPLPAGQQEQRRAALVDHASAVAPEGDLIEHLVVSVRLFSLQNLRPLLIAHGVEIRASGVNGARGQEVLSAQRPEASRLEGCGKGGQRFAAPDVQPVEGGEGLPRFRPLGFLFAADGREEQMGFVLPDKTVLLAQIGQLANLAVLPQIQPGFIAVFLRAAVGHHKGRPFSPGRVPQLGQEPVGQKIFQFQFFHMYLPSVIKNDHSQAASR